MDEACCTCASLLSDISPRHNEKTEKPVAHDRILKCCGRTICGNCIADNPRFGTYCPFCQISTKPSPLPQGLRNPPAYATNSSTDASPPPYSDDLPSYNSLSAPSQPPPAADEKSSSKQPTEDVLHFLDHEHDTLTSLSFRYKVPIEILRRSNNITSDHLLLARHAVLIPGEYYKGGVSLSPRPVEGEEEEKRKAILRRWMVACKVSAYDVALLYLEEADYDLEIAVEVYKDDERWEKEHPMEANVKGKGKTKRDVGSRRFTGQR